MLKAFSLWFSILFVLVSSQAWAHNEGSNQPTIHVQGSGMVDVMPDAFSITFILEQKGQVVSKLNERIETDLTNVIEFLLKQGVESNQIQSMQVRLTPRYESTPQGHRENGFVLSREVTVLHKKLSDYDRLIDGMLSRGVTRIQQFDFVITDQASYYKQALTAAVKDAKQRAQLLSKELDAKLGAVVQISETGGYAPVHQSKYRMAQAESSPSLPGQQSVSARVNVTFSIHK
ncbi:SIMPL domain-containing protein [Alteromonas sp. ASW11-130]|uniref:SIMPL domain-containing protein n=1 Tax=Alteromonas sp. ASW11-130 TaxID=3015775 RepID=UPI002241D93A|nr:SIMPL domain-containing protein [Alteromonas sp. ASW11-130]MCW8092287.1 SIMPL domain-containing protein [Alteromonas sp. ASW11-130]